MENKKKTAIKITALTLSVLLLICIVIAGMVILPQLREKGRRYMETTEFKNKGEVQMIAHRGASGLALENTLPAFIEAGQRTYYGIETDVHVTKDGNFIIVHDDDLKRIAGLDIEVENTDYADLRALRFADVYGESEEKNLFLPSLEEYIDVCKKYDKQAILEMKNPMTEETVAALAARVESLGWIERTTFISFSGENLLYLRKAYPSASAQYLTEDCTDEEIDFMIENKIDADLSWACVTRGRVQRLHNAGLKVNCWTVDGAACATLMADYGVDMITTNILE